MCTMPCFGLGMNATVTAQLLRRTVQVEDGRQADAVSMRGRIFAVVIGTGALALGACVAPPASVTPAPADRRAGRRRLDGGAAPRGRAEPRRLRDVPRRTTRGTRR